MELTHAFSVPASLGETWEAFNDIESVAECFPGAAVTTVEGDTFTGTCKVKLGPIALVYSGTGRFVEKDEVERRFVIEAKGKDKRGNGTAGATVTARFAEATAGTTDVEVLTELAITGRPAQFGRGVIQDVSEKLLGQFTDCLEARLAAVPSAEEVAAVAAAESPTVPEAEAEAEALPGAEPLEQLPLERPEHVLDLGTTVLPVLWRTYRRQLVGVLGALVALVVLRRLLRRS